MKNFKYLLWFKCFTFECDGNGVHMNSKQYLDMSIHRALSIYNIVEQYQQWNSPSVYLLDILYKIVSITSDQQHHPKLRSMSCFRVHYEYELFGYLIQLCMGSKVELVTNYA